LVAARDHGSQSLEGRTNSARPLFPIGLMLANIPLEVPIGPEWIQAGDWVVFQLPEEAENKIDHYTSFNLS
jgi:hypothetical protein